MNEGFDLLTYILLDIALCTVRGYGSTILRFLLPICGILSLQHGPDVSLSIITWAINAPQESIRTGEVPAVFWSFCGCEIVPAL